jgi:hypothetical protein
MTAVGLARSETSDSTCEKIAQVTMTGNAILLNGAILWKTPWQFKREEQRQLRREEIEKKSNGRETADTFHAGTVAEDGFGRVQAIFGRYGASVQGV